MRFLLCVVLSWGLLYTATPLKCLLCKAFGDNCVNSTVQQCKKDEDACITATWEETLTAPAGSRNVISVRGCMNSANFPVGYHSFTVTQTNYSRVIIDYCRTNLCNNKTVPLPPRDASPNGRKCPSCWSSTSSTCDATKKVKCIANEDRCVYYVSTVIIDDLPPQNYTFQGCTTHITCGTLLGVATTADGWFYEDVKRVDCTHPDQQVPTEAEMGEGEALFSAV